MSVIDGLTGRLQDQITLRATARRPAEARQAGAVPFTLVEGRAVFLLITSRRTGRWIFPKGALMEGLSAPETAAQEAFEEAGVRGVTGNKPLGLYRTLKTRGVRRFPIEVEMFPLRVLEQFEDWPEKNRRYRHWVTLPEMRRLLTDKALFGLAAQAIEDPPDLREIPGGLTHR